MKAIKEIREKYGLSQLQLASWLGISRSMLAMAETGKRGLSMEILKKINSLAMTYEPVPGSPVPLRTESAVTITQKLSIRKCLKDRLKQVNRQALRLEVKLNGLVRLSNHVHTQTAGIRKLQLSQTKKDKATGRQNLFIQLQQENSRLFANRVQQQFLLQATLLSLQFEAALLQQQLQTTTGKEIKLSQNNMLAIVQKLLVQ